MNSLPMFESSCVLDDSVVGHLSSDLRELCLAGEAWKFVSDLGNLRCNAGRNTLCGFGAMYAFFLIDDDFFLRQFLANFSVCHERLDLFFVVSETKTFRQDKVVISKSASFFSDKRRSCRIAFSQFCTPGSGLTKR